MYTKVCSEFLCYQMCYASICAQRRTFASIYKNEERQTTELCVAGGPLLNARLGIYDSLYICCVYRYQSAVQRLCREYCVHFV